MLLSLLLPAPLGQSGWGWLTLAALLLIAEIATGTQHLLLIGLAAGASGLVLLLFPALLPWDAALLIAALAALYAWWGWRQFHRRREDRPALNSAGDNLIGRTVRLSSPLEGGEGRVRLGDSSWAVTGDDLPEGTEVTITGREGNVLFVTAKK